MGSLPHADPARAVEFVLRHAPRLPYAPSLPNRSRRESMIAQASVGIRGIEVVADGSLAIDPGALDPDAPLDASLDTDCYVGLASLLDAVADHTGPLKISLTGPVTLGVALHAAGLEPSLAFRVSGSAVRSRALALSDLVRTRVPGAQVVAFLDEPSLGSCDHDGFPVGMVEAVDLVSGALSVLEGRAVTGLHCCATADWRLLIDAGPDVVSLPVDHAGGGATGALADFVGRGGWVAWGAVPTDRPLGPSVERLWRELAARWCDLVAAGCDPARIRTQALVTPACGLARHGATQAEQVAAFASGLAGRMHDQAVGVRLSIGA